VSVAEKRMLEGVASTKSHAPPLLLDSCSLASVWSTKSFDERRQGASSASDATNSSRSRNAIGEVGGACGDGG
jgi:hypothetical protein